MCGKIHYDLNKVCLLIIDMVKDNFDKSKNLAITEEALKIIPTINKLSQYIRKANGLIVYSTDSFGENDFIFSSKMKPHSIVGTKGAELINDLEKLPEDKHFKKPSFSAFFKTNLANYLIENNINTCLIAGIATQICVLSTTLDAISNNFESVLLSDCTASYSKKLHDLTISLYKKNPLFPLFRICNSRDIIAISNK